MYSFSTNFTMYSLANVLNKLWLQIQHFRGYPLFTNHSKLWIAFNISQDWTGLVGLFVLCFFLLLFCLLALFCFTIFLLLFSMISRLTKQAYMLIEWSVFLKVSSPNSLNLISALCLFLF